MPAVVGPLQLDDNEVCLRIDGEQIDSAAAVVPIAELLGEHVEVVAQHVDLRAQQSLEVIALAHLEIGERSSAERTEGVGRHFKKRHDAGKSVET